VTIGARSTSRAPACHPREFVGYDEHAHRRGPDSIFAHWSLEGIDRLHQGPLARGARVVAPRLQRVIFLITARNASIPLRTKIGAVERVVEDLIGVNKAGARRRRSASAAASARICLAGPRPLRRRSSAAAVVRSR